MVFSELHWVPSAVAAVSTILLAVTRDKRRHRLLGVSALLFGAIGLLDYLYEGNYSPWSLDFHTAHLWIGAASLALSAYSYAGGALLRRGGERGHCVPGYAAAALSLIALIMGAMMLLGITTYVPAAGEQVPASSVLPEVEAGQFQGILLTRLADQRNNAIKGTQIIDRDTYRLAVTGLVGRPLNLTYADLLALPAYSEVVYMPCVEGWGFTAKWTGFRITDLLRMAELSPDATYVLFRSADGYSSGLPLSYITARETLMAYGINDVTLPPDRGFPLQVVAADKYGYKWAKWVTSIEIGDEEVEGFWESRGYSNSGDVGGFPFG